MNSPAHELPLRTCYDIHPSDDIAKREVEVWTEDGGQESRHQYTNRIRYEFYHIRHVKVCAHRASMSMSVTVTAQQVGICVRIFKFFY
jgi:hypothetical protein